MRVLAACLVLVFLAACGSDGDGLASQDSTSTTRGSSSSSDALSTIESTPDPGITSTTVGKRTSTTGRHAMTSTTDASYGSGIRGRVTAGPTCPVQREGDTSCDDKPVVAKVTIRRADGSVQARRDTGTDGRYAATVPPGRYVVEATTDQAMSCSPSDATVPADGYATADISCDTGIR